MFTFRGDVISFPSFAETPHGTIMTTSASSPVPGGCTMTDPNPMQSLLRRHLGVDAFALDGDDTEVQDRWTDKPRKVHIPQDAGR